MRTGSQKPSRIFNSHPAASSWTFRPRPYKTSLPSPRRLWWSSSSKVCARCAETTEVFNDDLTGTSSWYQSTSQLIDLTQFPALTSLKICTEGYALTRYLIDVLSSISSAPALASITLDCGHWPNSGSDLDHLDIWLTQMAKNATVKGGLVLTLALSQGGKLVPEMLFPKFGEVAKTIVIPPEYPYRRRFGGISKGSDCLVYIIGECLTKGRI